MIARLFILLCAIAGAAALSQAPEATQQYTQRLGGAVDELTRIVQRFDADAAESGLDRAAALAAYETGGAFVQGQGARMAELIARQARLAAQYQALRRATPFERSYIVATGADREILQAALEDYRPAVPVTVDGAAHAALGALIFGLLGGFIVYLSGGGGRRVYRT